MSKIRTRSQPRLVSHTDDVMPLRRTRRRIRNLDLFGDRQDTKNAEADKARRAYESVQIPDPFKSVYTNALNGVGPTNILPPPQNPYTLLRFPNENNTLRQCIDAMVINIESHGYRLEYIGPEGQENSSLAVQEKARLEALLEQPNGEYSVIEFRERKRRDKETFGYAYAEICRGLYNNEIVSYYHVPAHTMRLTAQDKQATEIDVWLMRNGKLIKQKVKKRFRRFIQEVGARKVYFKEFGDPRRISSKTGLVEGTRENEQLADDELATEIYMSSLYSPGTAYGQPRWINQLPAVMGSRESELTNLQFFKDNAIPAMAVLVSGGYLTEGSIDEIEDMINAVRGSSAVNRIIILEAEGNETAASVDGKIAAPKIELKPLAADRQNDALFQEYDKNNQIKIRSSFRLPPIFIGLSEDLTYATAQSSLVMAEAQVFGPERNKVDDFFNFVILSDANGRPPVFWSLRSNPPRIVDPKTLVDALDTFDKMGALTPNIAIGIANELFDLSIAPIKEAWGDYPFSIVTALLQKDQLTGIEELTKIPDLTNADVVNDDGVDNLNPADEQIIEDTVKAPLKKLVMAAHVQRSRDKIRKRQNPRRKS